MPPLHPAQQLRRIGVCQMALLLVGVIGIWHVLGWVQRVWIGAQVGRVQQLVEGRQSTNLVVILLPRHYSLHLLHLHADVLKLNHASGDGCQRVHLREELFELLVVELLRLQRCLQVGEYALLVRLLLVDEVHDFFVQVLHVGCELFALGA